MMRMAEGRSTGVTRNGGSRYNPYINLENLKMLPDALTAFVAHSSRRKCNINALDILSQWERRSHVFWQQFNNGNGNSVPRRSHPEVTTGCPSSAGRRSFESSWSRVRVLARHLVGRQNYFPANNDNLSPLLVINY